VAITGTIPLSGAKGFLETTRGTAGTVTRVLPILGGNLQEFRETRKIAEHRYSYMRHYRSPIVEKVHVGISGFEVAPTFQSLPYYLAGAAKGGTAASTAVSTALKRWVFTPTAGSDDLKSYTLLVGDSTSHWELPFSLIDRFEFGWTVGGPATLSMDWVAQQATAAGAGTATTVVDADDINGALAKAYIDTSTVGSTLVTTVQDFKFTLENHWTPFFAPDGNLYPADFYRAEARAASVEATLAFTSTTEYNAFRALDRRKFRTVIDGGTIPGAGGSPYRVTIDWFGYWDEAPFGDQEGLRTIKVKGDSVVSTADGTVDWSITVDNDQLTIS
jgi:hypothetical protein